jgi:hypothetical protein
MERVAIEVICSVFDFPNGGVFIKEGKLLYFEHMYEQTGPMNTLFKGSKIHEVRTASDRDAEGISIINQIKTYYVSKSNYR